MTVVARARLMAVAVGVATFLCAVATPAVAAVSRTLPGTDPTLTLTAAGTGTTLYGGVGAALVAAPPYQVSGGSGQVTWSYQGLPPGLAVSPSNGVIGGTPSLSGTYDVTVSVADADGQTQTGAVTYYIDPIGLAAESGIFPYVVALSGRAVGSAPVVATGDTEGLTWSATGLPSGLTIDPGSGVVSGTPTTVGGYTAHVKVTNVAGATAYLPVLFEIVVGYTCNYHQTARVGRPLTINCGVFWSPNPNRGGQWLGLPGQLSYSGRGLPRGLRLNPNDGLVTGTPRKASTASFTVTVDAQPDGILVTGPTHWTSVVRCVVTP